MGKKAHGVQSGWEELLTGYANNHMFEDRLKARLKGEGRAKAMLEQKLGQFSEEDIREFLAALNADYWNDKERKDRFMPAFYGSLANQIAGSKAAFNQWTKKLWQASENDIDALLDEFWQKNEVAGSGTSLPTAILYLRDPDRYPQVLSKPFDHLVGGDIRVWTTTFGLSDDLEEQGQAFMAGLLASVPCRK